MSLHSLEQRKDGQMNICARPGEPDTVQQPEKRAPLTDLHESARRLLLWPEARTATSRQRSKRCTQGFAPHGVKLLPAAMDESGA